ncbi:MFS transporter [Novosphingobium sp. G106]|uniref:MFS transporter n=1 Tax=Novosphingobium sp. G106 TaxID=2849500 RepID=UPI001C2D61A9|nr:MFS transporter [Novosphingobium sp. G106]MBV1686215.1 MFS transporter [Novosphingobium sp. G106]
MAPEREISARREWANNWPLVLCSLLGIPVPIFAIYSLGQFLPSLEHEFGWSRTETSAGMSAALILSFLVTPLAGRVVDRVNARRLVIPGIVLSALALAGFSLATASPALWLVIWACHALAAALIGPAVWLAVIAHAFDKGRSLAMAVALCGVSLPAAVAPPLARMLIDEFGWRSAYQLLAVVVALPAFFVCTVFFFDRRSFGESRHVGAPLPIVRPPLRAIYLSPTFLKLAISVLVSFTASAGCLIHLAPALSDRGFSPMTAASIAGSAGLAAIPGKIALGALFDRAGTAVVSVGVMVTFALACALMALPSSSITIALTASLLMGICSGGLVALLACLTPRFFAPSVFGSVYAVLLSLTALGGALGPLLASVVHDAAGSYAPALWAAVVASLLSAILFAYAKPLVVPG